jgi:hypothetical protein
MDKYQLINEIEKSIIKQIENYNSLLNRSSDPSIVPLEALNHISDKIVSGNNLNLNEIEGDTVLYNGKRVGFISISKSNNIIINTNDEVSINRKPKIKLEVFINRIFEKEKISEDEQILRLEKTLLSLQ